MAHTSQDRFSPLVLAKLRKELKLKDGIVFNNDYEGDPKAGAVKVPVRDTEVAVSDYSTSAGLAAAEGATTYTTVSITKDKAVNEIIDKYKAASVPDGIVAERLDSAGYSLAYTMDSDGGTVLLSGGTAYNSALITKANIYDTLVDIGAAMDTANVPNDNMRYFLATPATKALLVKSPEFIAASALGDDVKQTGSIGQVAGFNIIPWNDSTANLAGIAGHPKFATRVKEWQVPVDLVDLGSPYIGASAVQGRMVYDHAVLRATAVRPVYSPTALTITLAKGATTGTTIATVAAGTSFKYKINPATNATFGLATATYGGTALTSGTTEIAVSAGDVIEIVDIVSTKVAGAGYVTVSSNIIK